MRTWKGKTESDPDGTEWPDIFDPENWAQQENQEHNSLALPGPPLSEEQILLELQRAEESGVAKGNVVKRILSELRQGSQASKAA